MRAAIASTLAGMRRRSAASGCAAESFSSFRAQEPQAIVELRLAGVRAPSDAHRTVDARLGLRPGVVGVKLAPQLRPPPGEAIQRPALLLDATVRGSGRRLRGRRRGTDPLAPDELQHRAQRTLGLPELAQQPARGVDLLGRVVDARDDHAARLHLGVEGLEVRPRTATQRWLHLERDAVLRDLLAQLDLDALGTSLQRRIRWQEDGRDEVRRVLRTPPDDPADRLAKEQVGPFDGRVHGEHEPRYVHALADHVDRHEPPRRPRSVATTGEALDARVGAGLVADDDDRLLAGDRSQQRSRGASMRPVVAEDEAGGIRHHLASFAEQRIRIAKHPGQQRGRGIDRRAQPARVVARIEVVGEGRERLLRVHAPPQCRVDEAEREWAADPFGDGLRVAVDEVRLAATLVVVADEGDRARVRAKRRAGQREPSMGAVERRAQCRSPVRRLAGVMDLVEHHERATREVMGEEVGGGRDLLVGHDDAIHIGSPCPVGVAPARIQVQPDAVGRVSPLGAQRRRRAHDDDLLAAGGPRSVARRQRLARAGRGDEQVVGRSARDVIGEERGLPGAGRHHRHSMRPPLARLQVEHSACPFDGAVAPPARRGSTWSACHPGASRTPQRAHRPPAARNSATRAEDPKRRAAIEASLAACAPSMSCPPAPTVLACPAGCCNSLPCEARSIGDRRAHRDRRVAVYERYARDGGDVLLRVSHPGRPARPADRARRGQPREDAVRPGHGGR